MSRKTAPVWRIVVRDIDGLHWEFGVSRWKLTADHILELDNGDECVMDVAWMQVEAWT